MNADLPVCASDAVGAAVCAEPPDGCETGDLPSVSSREGFDILLAWAPLAATFPGLPSRLPRLRHSWRLARDGSSGIALLELMLAVAILGVALISLGIAVGRCVRGLAAVEHVRAAIEVAEQVLAERRLAALGEGEVKTGTFEGERPTSRGPIAWEQRVETTDDPEILRSTLVVRWKERGQSRERSFTGLVGRKILRVAETSAPAGP